MPRKTHTVWESKNGQELLRHKGDGQWYIPLSSFDNSVLFELSEAVQDAVMAVEEKELENEHATA